MNSKYFSKISKIFSALESSIGPIPIDFSISDDGDTVVIPFLNKKIRVRLTDDEAPEQVAHNIFLGLGEIVRMVVQNKDSIKIIQAIGDAALQEQSLSPDPEVEISGSTQQPDPASEPKATHPE